MSIATALTALADDVSAAKAAITAKGGTAPNGTADMADAIAAIPSGGITPTGNINITDTNVTDVTNYATATVVDADLVASNIKEGVNILGILGTFAGGGGSLPSSISKIDGGSFTYASTTPVTAQITHNLGVIPRGVIVWTEEADMGQYFYGGGVIRFNSTGISDGAYRIIVYRSGAAALGNSSVLSSYSSSLTNTFWTINHGSYSYQAGKTYKWLAWA